MVLAQIVRDDSKSPHLLSLSNNFFRKSLNHPPFIFLKFIPYLSTFKNWKTLSSKTRRCPYTLLSDFHPEWPYHFPLHQQGMDVLAAPLTPQRLMMLVLYSLASLSGVSWHLSVVLSHSFFTKCNAHPLTGFLTFCASSAKFCAYLWLFKIRLLFYEGWRPRASQCESFIICFLEILSLKSVIFLKLVFSVEQWVYFTDNLLIKLPAVDLLFWVFSNLRRLSKKLEHLDFPSFILTPPKFWIHLGSCDSVLSSVYSYWQIPSFHLWFFYFSILLDFR